MDLNRVDLNLLVAFDALMAERSVTAAAARLSVGQSAMSSTLARLRKLLNDPVLVREGRTMVATPVAEALAEPVQQALADIQSMLSGRRSFDPAVDRRVFTVVASSYVAIVLLHPLLVHLAVEAPNIQLRIQPVGDGLDDLFARNTVDLAILPREALAGRNELHHEVLYADDYVVVADRVHPDIGDTITLGQFSELPYLVSSSDLHPSLAEAQLDVLGVPRRVEVASGFEVAPFLLRDTRLISLLPRLFACKVEHAADLRLLEPPMPLNPLTEAMLWTRRLDDDPAHTWLRRRLHTLAREITHGLGVSAPLHQPGADPRTKSLSYSSERSAQT
ncbi:LysR family transcriptional regulator [Pseudonocardia sp. DSM 110487]|uniref:LysR family transcriptional regulator n=1 Tax=Pseudonocardia sp. DSM 110487 TaxID=2865833 RepID=UPI001C6A5E8B|nr:LysR family transcriptional regulator [Pseudonocardia sp. DSM 110487]QYN33526.1 LysR family transcriptional regulator [Pseudonocardia sp. DSM 110487]